MNGSKLIIIVFVFIGCWWPKRNKDIISRKNVVNDLVDSFECDDTLLKKNWPSKAQLNYWVDSTAYNTFLEKLPIANNDTTALLKAIVSYYRMDRHWGRFHDYTNQMNNAYLIAKGDLPDPSAHFSKISKRLQGLYLVEAIYHKNLQFCRFIGLIKKVRGASYLTTDYSIYFMNPEMYERSKVKFLDLGDSTNSEINNKIIDDAYNATDRWLNQLKTKSLQELRNKQVDILAGSKAHWVSEKEILPDFIEVRH